MRLRVWHREEGADIADSFPREWFVDFNQVEKRVLL